MTHSKKAKKNPVLNRELEVEVTKHAIEQFYARVSWAATQSESQATRFLQSIYRHGKIDRRGPSPVQPPRQEERAPQKAQDVTQEPQPVEKITATGAELQINDEDPEENIALEELIALYSNIDEEEVDTNQDNKSEATAKINTELMPSTDIKSVDKDKPPRRDKNQIFAMVFQGVHAIILVQYRRAVVLTCLGQKNAINWHVRNEIIPRYSKGRIKW